MNWYFSASDSAAEIAVQTKNNNARISMSAVEKDSRSEQGGLPVKDIATAVDSGQPDYKPAHIYVPTSGNYKAVVVQRQVSPPLKDERPQSNFEDGQTSLMSEFLEKESPISPGSKHTPLLYGSKGSRHDDIGEPKINKAKRSLHALDVHVQNASGYLKKVRIQQDPVNLETEDCNAVIEEVSAYVMNIMKISISSSRPDYLAHLYLFCLDSVSRWGNIKRQFIFSQL